MRIECPACHLTGTVNELEIPSGGRDISCPRCKHDFHLDQPPAVAELHLMNVCPACQYSTFSEEMFAVCPKCGTTEKEFREQKTHRQQETARLERDAQALHRSYRNPDLVAGTPERPEAVQESAPQPLRVAGWLSTAAGGVLLFYGAYGLAGYYGKDWQAILSAPLLEPLSSTRVFFRLGLLPWLTTLYGLGLTVVAGQFLRRAPWARRGLAYCAWTGLALVACHQIAGFIAWAGVASVTAGFFYYFTGVLNALLMTALWGAPFVVLRWYLEHDAITTEFPDE
ncbi:MAG TPA: zinc-ribbon domain-containing protein [Geobacteraceae bacterium]